MNIRCRDFLSTDEQDRELIDSCIKQPRENGNELVGVGCLRGNPGRKDEFNMNRGSVATPNKRERTSSIDLDNHRRRDHSHLGQGRLDSLRPRVSVTLGKKHNHSFTPN